MARGVLQRILRVVLQRAVCDSAAAGSAVGRHKPTAYTHFPPARQRDSVTRRPTKTNRGPIMKLVISAVLLLGSAMALADSPFDGTWKMKPDSMKITGKADQFQLLDGVYTCGSCAPEIKVKADGSDQPVTGHSYFDTVAVVVQSPSTIQ